MAKYLLLKHYRGAPASVNDIPMDQWTPDEIQAHIQYMNDFADRLKDTGEYVNSQALAPEGAWVRYDGEGPPPVHRRPVRRDQGPDRGLDDRRRRLLRARRRVGRRTVGGTRRGRQADPRVARGAPVLRRPRRPSPSRWPPVRWTSSSFGI